MRTLRFTLNFHIHHSSVLAIGIMVYIYSTYFSYNWGFVIFNLIFILHWSIIDLQCCVSFRCIAKWFSYTYIPSFSDSFPYRLLQNTESSSLCYTVGPYWLSILHIVMCIYSSQLPNLSLAHFCPSVIISFFLSLWVCLCFVNKLIYIISKKFNI